MRKGRPPAQWMEMKSERRKTLTLHELAHAIDLTASAVRRTLLRVGVEGELKKNGQQYVKVYEVAAIREAYKASIRAYKS